MTLTWGSQTEGNRVPTSEFIIKYAAESNDLGKKLNIMTYSLFLHRSYSYYKNVFVFYLFLVSLKTFAAINYCTVNFIYSSTFAFNSIPHLISYMQQR